jgi:hypothetical protein
MSAQTSIDETGQGQSIAVEVGSRSAPRISLWLGVAIWIAGAAAGVAGIVLLELNQATLATHPEIMTYPPWLTSGLAYVIVGGLIVARRPANSIGWILSAGGLAGVISYAAAQYAIYALLTRPTDQFLAPEAAWLSNWLWLFWGSFYPLLILLYPDGKPPSRRWRWAVWFDCSIFAILCLPIMVGTWSVRRSYLFDDRGAPQWMNDFFATAPLLLLGGILISCLATFFRYRVAQSAERAQIRWMVYAASLEIIIFFPPSAEFTKSLLANTPLRDDPTALVSATNIFYLLLPVCIGVAIFKYHLFDIDRLINRTIVYGMLTGILAVFYLSGVALLQSLLHSLTGAGSDLAIVATTLMVAALFLPLRTRIQHSIDRRFYRRKYDAARTLEAFSASLRDKVDLNDLREGLLAVVDETMQPSHVGLWLKADLRGKR